MYNRQKEVIFIKIKEITFIFCFIFFSLMGAAIFLFVEKSLFEAMIVFSIGLVIFTMILVYNLNQNFVDNSISENENQLIQFNELVMVKQESAQPVILNQESKKLKAKELDLNENEFIGLTNNQSNIKIPMVDYITLKMNQDHFENLNSLIDQLEQAKLITENEDFKNEAQSKVKIYAKLFPSLPIVNVIKDRHLGFKVLGGLDVLRIYELGQISEEDLPYVKDVYPKTKNLIAIIEGGKIKDFETDPPSQKFLPYRIKIKFYQ